MNASSPNPPPALTVGEALSGAAREMERAEVASARLTAELLLGHVLHWDRVRVLTHPEQRISEAQRQALQDMVRRCAGGEPLQYVTRKQEFYGLPFTVTTDVLIPRPETELLVEHALEVAARAGLPADLRFIDVGTGSGCIAVALAVQRAGWRGCATDVSPAALAVARRNAVEQGVDGRLDFICGDLLECFSPDPLFDLMVSNPPYVAGSDLARLPRSVRDHEPRGALLGGESGLETIERLLSAARTCLRGRGYLLVEIGAGQSEDVTRLLGPSGWILEGIHPDLQGIPRCLVARKAG